MNVSKVNLLPKLPQDRFALDLAKERKGDVQKSEGLASPSKKDTQTFFPIFIPHITFISAPKITTIDTVFSVKYLQDTLVDVQKALPQNQTFLALHPPKNVDQLKAYKTAVEVMAKELIPDLKEVLGIPAILPVKKDELDVLKAKVFVQLEKAVLSLNKSLETLNDRALACSLQLMVLTAVAELSASNFNLLLPGSDGKQSPLNQFTSYFFPVQLLDNTPFLTTLESKMQSSDTECKVWMVDAKAENCVYKVVQEASESETVTWLAHYFLFREAGWQASGIKGLVKAHEGDFKGPFQCVLNGVSYVALPIEKYDTDVLSHLNKHGDDLVLKEVANDLAVPLLKTVGSILAGFHELGGVVNDLKATNVLVKTDDTSIYGFKQIVLGDLAELHVMGDGVYGLIRQGCSGVTYRTPEALILDSSASQKTDSWNLGTLVQELLSGFDGYALQGYTTVESLKEGLKAFSTFVANHSDELPVSLQGFVKQCLTPDPKDRPSVPELLKKL